MVVLAETIAPMEQTYIHRGEGLLTDCERRRAADCEMRRAADYERRKAAD